MKENPDPDMEAIRNRVEDAFEDYNHACFDAAKWYEDWKRRRDAAIEEKYAGLNV